MEKRRRRKGMEGVYAKKKKMKKKKKEKGEKRRGEGEKRRGEEEKRKKKKKKNRESSARDAPPSPDAFPSTKLGNSMTPIKGRLGKNTTPTCRRTVALTPNLQKDLRRRRSNFDSSSHADFSYASEKAKYTKNKPHSNETAIYKKIKALENSCNRSKFSINPH